MVLIGGWATPDPPAFKVSDAGATGATIAVSVDKALMQTPKYAQPIVSVSGANVSVAFTDSTIDIPPIAAGMWIRGGAHVSFSNSRTLQHDDGLHESNTALDVAGTGSALTVDHSQVVSGINTLSVSNGGSATVRDSFVAQLRTVLPADTSNNAAIFVSTNDGGTASATIVGSTVVAYGPNSDAALRVSVVPAGGSPSATVTNSILRAVDTTSDGPSADLSSTVSSGAGTATITAGHSGFSTVLTSGGGTAPAAGAGTNVAGDPLFVNVPADFRLLPGSPLLDRGDASIVTAGEKDLDGNPRSLDSNDDCVVAPDLGAYELTGHVLATCPPAPPSGSGSQGGDVQQPPPGPGPAVADTLAPVLTKLGFLPKRFAVGKRSTAKSARRAKQGSTLRFTLSEAARVTITIQRQKLVRKKKRWVSAGRLVRRKRAAGVNRIAFSGRIGKRALKPGRYRAVVVAVDAAGNSSKPKTAAFAIMRR